MSTTQHEINHGIEEGYEDVPALRVIAWVRCTCGYTSEGYASTASKGRQKAILLAASHTEHWDEEGQ